VKAIPRLNNDELREIQWEIEQKLPISSLKSVNLESELLKQYKKVLNLQEDALSDEDVPANQKAQVAAQVAAVLRDLIKLQEDLSLATTLRLMEEALIESLQLLPEEAKESYFSTYERLARGKGL
jgi:hypothetical protein